MKLQIPQTPYEAKVFRLGASPERALPVGAWRGRILLRGTITDNATTAADLLAAASMYDRAILDVAGLSSATANPKVVIRFERIGFALDAPAETPALLGSLLKEVELTHTPAGGNTRTRRLQLHGFSTQSFSETMVAAGPLYASQITRAQTYRIPFSPLVVNCEVDTFNVSPRAAVNTAADVPFSLYADVYIHSNAGWVRQDPQCGIDEDVAGAQIEALDDARSASLFDPSAGRTLAGALAARSVNRIETRKDR